MNTHPSLMELFSTLKAEQEPWLTEVFVPPSDYAKLQWDHCQVIYGAPGSGKTALRLALARKTQNRVLVVPWSPIPSEDQDLQGSELVKFAMQQAMQICVETLVVAGNLPERLKKGQEWLLKILVGFLNAYLPYGPTLYFQSQAFMLKPETITWYQELIDHTEPLQISSKEDYQHQMRLFLGLLKGAGYDGAWLMIDGLEKWPTNSARRVEQMLEAILSSLVIFDPTMPQTDQSPVWIFKFFVPLSIKDTLEQTSGISRHRAEGINLQYKEDQLQKLISKRVCLEEMESFQFEKMCQDEDFFEWMYRYAGENPRGWMQLGYPFIEKYLLSNEPLTPKIWKEIAHQNPPQLHLDLLNRQVWVGQQRIEINSPIEFNILKYLYQHRERVCSLEEIYYHCIEELEYIPPKDDDQWRHKSLWRPALDTTIWRIRQKLEPDSKNPIYLKTFPRQGLQICYANLL